MAVDLAAKDSRYWARALNVISAAYSKGAYSVSYEASLMGFDKRSAEWSQLPVSIARTITGEPEKYPRSLVMIADERCREDIGSRIVPVAEMSRRQAWFWAGWDAQPSVFVNRD